MTSSLGIDAVSLLHTSPARSALLIVSLTSFLGAILILGVLMWVLHQAAR
jgi:hypothetical protein